MFGSTLRVKRRADEESVQQLLLQSAKRQKVVEFTLVETCLVEDVRYDVYATTARGIAAVTLDSGQLHGNMLSDHEYLWDETSSESKSEDSNAESHYANDYPDESSSDGHSSKDGVGFMY